MSSRERLLAALNHHESDRVPVDFGGTAVTGIHVLALTRLRRAVLGDPKYRVKVIEPYQMLGEVDAELLDALEIDVVGLFGRTNLFGFENRGWKPFTLFDGTEVLCRKISRVAHDDRGGWVIFPQGDTRPAQRTHAQGILFLRRHRAAASDRGGPTRPLGQYRGIQSFSDADLAWYREQINVLDAQSQRGIVPEHAGHGVRRHRHGAGALDETSQRHPRHRRVVYGHRRPQRLRVAGFREAMRNRPEKPRNA